MGKQIFDMAKKVLGVSFLVLLVTSMMVTLVSAQPEEDKNGPTTEENDKQMSYGGDDKGGDKDCAWSCSDPYKQKYFNECYKKWICDYGHWCKSGGKQYWQCDSGHWAWICKNMKSGSACNNWQWKCC